MRSWLERCCALLAALLPIAAAAVQPQVVARGLVHPWAVAFLPEGRFLEIHVDAPLATCRQRDPKGLYARADRGKIADLTGRDQAYEPPEDPALVLRTAEEAAEDCAERVVKLVLART